MNKVPNASSVLDLVRDWNRQHDCPDDSELDDYSQGSATDEARRKLEAHLAVCPICRAYVAYGRAPGRKQRGQAALRSLLDHVNHVLGIALAWIAVHPRASAGMRLAQISMWPAAAIGLTALAMHNYPSSPASEINASQTLHPIERESLRSVSEEIPATVARAALWRPFSAAPPLLAQIAKGSVSGPRQMTGITLLKIGEQSAFSDHAGEANGEAAPIPVHRFETLTVRITNALPRGARVYTAVRQNGGHWEIGDGIDVTPEKTSFRMDCKFGSQEDDLALFDVRVLVDRDNLPPGPVPDALLSSRAVLATSPIFRVQRMSMNRPVLAITHISYHEVWDGAVLWVYDESGIQIFASKLPIGAKIGLAVQPTRPLNNERWVQVDEIDGPGTIDSHWGDPGYHSFVRFAVTAFAVPAERDFPPRGVAISPVEWAGYSSKFLSISAPITVIKAGDHFTIEELNNQRVPVIGRVMAEPQADIRGMLDRPIGAGERIWLVCAPGDANGSKPWIAGSTIDGVDNAWVAKAVQLWKRGQPSSFDLLGVLSSADPNQVDPSKLREWANSYEHTVNRVTLQIGETRALGRR